MQKNVQYLYLYFTKDDQDLLAWANMIKENDLSLSTWIQGILVAEAAKEKLNIGAIQKPLIQKPIKKNITPCLWGDDTKKEDSQVVPGWHVRGENGKLIVGTVLPIKITRPLAQEALFELKKRHKKIAPYVKAVIRQNLEILPAGPDLPPNKNTVIDLFVLCEGKIKKNNSMNHAQRDKKERINQGREEHQTKNIQTSQQKQEGQQGRAGKNPPTWITPTPPQQKSAQKKQGEQGQTQSPTRKNPLLNQID